MFVVVCLPAFPLAASRESSQRACPERRENFGFDRLVLVVPGSPEVAPEICQRATAKKRSFEAYIRCSKLLWVPVGRSAKDGQIVHNGRAVLWHLCLDPA